MNTTDSVNPDVRSSDEGHDDNGSESKDPQQSGQDVKKRREIGGRKGPDPTRYGDWEKAGRCIDF